MPQMKNINFWFCYWISYVSFCSYVTAQKQKNHKVNFQLSYTDSCSKWSPPFRIHNSACLKM